MKSKNLRFAKGFRVVLGNPRSQAAERLAPGKSEGNAHNRHRGADPWLYVVSGTSVATVNKRKHAVKADTLLLIERGDELPAGKPGEEGR